MSKDESEKQYLLFIKYTREYISQVTGYSKHTLSRIATGNRAPSEPFIGLCCHVLKESQDDLFRLVKPHETSSVPAGPQEPYQDLIETIDTLASQLTKAQAQIKALEDENKKYG